MKNKILKIRKLLITTVLLIAIIGIPCISIGRAHTSSHSSSRSISHSVKSSTPKTSTKSTSSSVKSSTPKTSTTKSSSTGKTYTTTKDTSSSRTTIKHETVKPKENAGGTTIINSNPTYYNNYSTGRSYSITNSIFQYYMLNEIFKDKESVTEKDIVKALEEKGYSKEEVDQILDEAKQEENINKPFYDGWKWYNWTIFAIIILASIGIIIWIIWLLMEF
jgi:hypothetical protein|nr:MAG TPA: Cytochrome C biogenesis protein [Caudoviricetes sp.]